MAKGKFIVLEGTDGSGKTEQTFRLASRLRDEGYSVVDFDFPRYNEPSSWFVKEYLNGRFGSFEEIGPKIASIFYAMDRYAASPGIRSAIERGDVVVSNRYVASNLGHQGSKIVNSDERKEYFQWDYDLEYRINKIPKPDINIILHVPAEIAQQLVSAKSDRKYLEGKKKDIHEESLEHLKRTENVYLELAELFPNDFVVVECVENGKLSSVEEIHQKIWEIVRKIL